ncbi:solute carrier family 22 member 13-like [Pectinophora gossypiella]|uniref:solute carrier family 22 member 13-like n=1 Tax=Pectinophora gossypiella TaxID=13191 RepID=UPI00214EF737|nr:solute carrier family 22 member 13-like [Pectinophora gossypiella]
MFSKFDGTGQPSGPVNNENGLQKNKEDTKEIVDYDQLLSSAGEFGLYQILLLASLFPFYIFGAFSYFSQLFMTEVAPNHWCWIPELENLTVIERRNLAIPNDTAARFGYSQCSAYVANWSEVLATGLAPDLTWETQRCQHGWEFNKTEIPYPTISSDMGWVCDKDSYQASAQSIFFVGSIIGGFLVGWVADRFGRLPGAAFSNFIGCIAGIASAFVHNFTEFAVCRFFMGMSYDNCMMMTYILALEYVAPKYRAISANIPFALFFTFGLCILPWIALACADWKTLTLATSIPMGLSLLAPLLMPESPRWLLTKGRVDDAVQKVVKIGHINKKLVPPRMIEQFKKDACRQEEKGSILELLRRPLLRTMFICICVLYMSDMIVFDSLVRTVGQLKFDFFVSFTIVSMTEFPSLVIVSFVLDWTGRKWMTLVTLLICGIFSIITTFVGAGLPSVLCAVVARFCANMACNTAMQWAAEILPTPVRGSGISVVHICGYVGTVISPFIVYLETVVEWLPLIVVGAIAFLGAAVCLGLPETAAKEMPQTFDDAEELIKSTSMLEYPWRKTAVRETPRDYGHVNNNFEMN